MKWELLNVIKKCPEPCFTITLIYELDLIRETSYHWQLFVSNFCDISKGCLCKISFRLSNIALLFLREMLRSYPFLMSRNFERLGCQWCGVKRIKFTYLGKKGIEHPRLVHFYFFNKTDFEHYLFNTVVGSHLECSLPGRMLFQVKHFGIYLQR